MFFAAFIVPPTFPTHSFVHKEEEMSHEELLTCKKKKTVTDRGQEPTFSGRYKPPASSVSENFLKLSNSSFSYSDIETVTDIEVVPQPPPGSDNLILNSLLRSKESQCNNLKSINQTDRNFRASGKSKGKPRSGK